MTSTFLRPTAAALARYPIPVELIAALYRASESEFTTTMATLPEYGRARIAAYCNGRERLNRLGLKIAATCEEAALIKAAGAEAGTALFAHSRTDRVKCSSSPIAQEPSFELMLIIDLPVATTKDRMIECLHAA